MSIYEKSGGLVLSPYSVSGGNLNQAYDVNGVKVFDGTGIPLKVMTYNVGTWYEGKHTNVPAAKDEEYYNLQNGMIQRDNPDILCMCEYCKQFSKSGRTALSMLQQYFPYIHEQGGDNPDASNSNGRCIASKYPITNYTVHNFGDGSGLYYDSCTITVDNVPITVVVTHLVYSGEEKRIAELKTVIQFLQTQEKFILCGDLNTLVCKSTTDKNYIDMIQLLLDAGFHIANCGNFGFLVTYSDEPTGTWTGCLDNIVTSSNIQILSAHVDTTKLTDGLQEKTDHMPLIAELSIGTT